MIKAGKTKVLSLSMAISVILLNKWLINLIDINGAALATLIVVVFYSVFKIIYIKFKLKIQPFSFQTVKIVFVVSFIFIAFYFWNFNFHPLLNILLKCIVISVLYIMIIKKIKISEDINGLFEKYFSLK